MLAARPTSNLSEAAAELRSSVLHPGRVHGRWFAQASRHAPRRLPRTPRIRRGGGRRGVARRRRAPREPAAAGGVILYLVPRHRWSTADGDGAGHIITHLPTATGQVSPPRRRRGRSPGATAAGSRRPCRCASRPAPRRARRRPRRRGRAGARRGATARSRPPRGCPPTRGTAAPATGRPRRRSRRRRSTARTRRGTRGGPGAAPR